MDRSVTGIGRALTLMLAVGVGCAPASGPVLVSPRSRAFRAESLRSQFDGFLKPGEHAREQGVRTPPVASAAASVEPPFTYDLYCDEQGHFTYDGAALDLLNRAGHLQLLYLHADQGHARAKQVVRELEDVFRRFGAWVAEETTRPDCLPLPELVARCLPKLGFINNLFGNTPEVHRLRAVVAQEYEVRARQRGAQNEVILATLSFLLATGMLKGAVSPTATPRLRLPGGSALVESLEGETGAAASTKLKGLGNIGSHGTPIDPTTALNAGTKWLGAGYTELSPGVYRSGDGLRQFRMTSADLAPTHGDIGSHIHFEALDEAGTVIENLHLPVER